MKQKDKFKQTEIGIIPEDWEVKRIGDLVKINDKAIGREFKYSEIEYIDIDSVENGHIKNIQKINLKEAPSRAKRIINNEDIIISTVRPNLKHFAFINQAKPNSIVSTGFTVISCKRINPRFLYYFLTTDKYTEYLTAIADAHTSTYPSFNPDIIENSYCPFPSEAEQINIAKILSGLDSKIELNQKIIKVLKAIGQALFKRWFIDFEFPNEEGKPYKSSGGELVDSELGEIPEGWVVVQLGQFISHSKKAMKPYEKPEQYYSYYSVAAFDNGKVPMKVKGKYIISNKYVVKPNSILVCKLNPRIPRIWAIGNIDEASSICSTEFQVFSPDKEELFSYSYFLFNSNLINKLMKSMVTGTSSSHQRTRPADILNIKAVIPPDELAAVFNNLFMKALIQINNLMRENDLLSQIRDSVLPKLTSGQIRVPAEARG